MTPHVVITGAAGGIGSALVCDFASSGYRVIGLDSMPEPSGFSGSCYLRLDLERFVLDEAYRAQGLTAIRECLNQATLGVLVNNAAVQVLGGVDTLTLAGWQRTLNVNLLAPFVLSQALLPELEAARGCVINISSITPA